MKLLKRVALAGSATRSHSPLKRGYAPIQCHARFSLQLLLGAADRPGCRPRIDVKMRRLDGVMDEVLGKTSTKHSCLKIDTQGFDIQVVKSTGLRIREFVGLLSEMSATPVYELMPSYLDALALYQSLGFGLHRFTL